MRAILRYPVSLCVEMGDGQAPTTALYLHACFNTKAEQGTASSMVQLSGEHWIGNAGADDAHVVPQPLV